MVKELEGILGKSADEVRRRVQAGLKEFEKGLKF